MIKENEEIITASENENQNLFLSSVCIFEILKVVMLLEVQLVSVKRFVEVNYQYIISFEKAIDMMLNKVKKKLTDFIEDIFFVNNCDVVMTEKLTDEAKTSLQQFIRMIDS